MRKATTVTVRVPPAPKNPLAMLANAGAVIRKGVKDLQAGRTVSHQKAARWLRSWGRKREQLPPKGE